MNKLSIQIFCFLLASIFFTFCKAQSKAEVPHYIANGQISFTSQKTKLTKTQGTTEHQNVHCSLQDKYGNLWFGTTGEGVFRYDGKKFTQFTEKDGLSNNKVWSVLEDTSGNIWFGTDNGVCLYNGKKISKITFSQANLTVFPASLSQSGSNAVWCMMQDKKGIIWFGTTDDVYCYDGKSFFRFLSKSNISNKQNLQLKRIQCFLEDSNGNIWMGSGPIAMEGVILFDGKSITSSKPNGDGWIRSMAEDKNGQIWFGGRGNGNFIYNGKSFTNFTLNEGIGNPLLVDKAGRVWFSGGEKNATIENEGGIWRYDGKSFENFTLKNGISKYSVWSMLEDKSGNIWIGTRNCRLYRYDGQVFETFSE